MQQEGEDSDELSLSKISVVSVGLTSSLIKRTLVWCHPCQFSIS